MYQASQAQQKPEYHCLAGRLTNQKVVQNRQLDHKIFSAVRKQAKEKGLKYESDKIAY